MDKEFVFNYKHYDSLSQLSADEQELIEAAKEAGTRSYSPYSHFKVGAAARLESGKIVTGSNQESEVFPAGICAERNLLFHHQASMPEDKVVTLVITSKPDERECYPCGICRQVLYDVEKRQASPIKVIMCSATSATVVDKAACLLPFQFEL